MLLRLLSCLALPGWLLADTIFYIPDALVDGFDTGQLALHLELDFFGEAFVLETEYRGLGGNPPVHAFEIAPSEGIQGQFVSFQLCVRAGTDEECCTSGDMSEMGFYGGYNEIPVPGPQLSPDLSGCEPDTAVGELLPVAFKLDAPVPNPFNPATRVTFSLPVGGDVRAELFDLAGHSIRVLSQARFPAGTHMLQIDGEGLSSGLYLLHFTALGQQQTLKLSLLR